MRPSTSDAVPPWRAGPGFAVAGRLSVHLSGLSWSPPRRLPLGCGGNACDMHSSSIPRPRSCSGVEEFVPLLLPLEPLDSLLIHLLGQLCVPLLLLLSRALLLYPCNPRLCIQRAVHVSTCHHRRYFVVWLVGRLSVCLSHAPVYPPPSRPSSPSPWPSSRRARPFASRVSRTRSVPTQGGTPSWVRAIVCLYAVAVEKGQKSARDFRDP